MKLNHFYQHINKQHLNTTLLDTLVTLLDCATIHMKWNRSKVHGSPDDVISKESVKYYKYQ